MKIDDKTQEYKDLIDKMLLDEKYERSESFLLSIKKYIEKSGHISEKQIYSIERILSGR
jgi:hypothetical protein